MDRLYLPDQSRNYLSETGNQILPGQASTLPTTLQNLQDIGAKPTRENAPYYPLHGNLHELLKQVARLLASDNQVLYSNLFRNSMTEPKPPFALLFTCDATLMHTNIDTDHTIIVITWWHNDLFKRGLLPENFPLDAVLSAMVIIMRNNLCEFGGLYFLQILGTYMGTSTVVM